MSDERCMQGRRKSLDQRDAERRETMAAMEYSLRIEGRLLIYKRSQSLPVAVEIKCWGSDWPNLPRCVLIGTRVPRSVYLFQLCQTRGRTSPDQQISSNDSFINLQQLCNLALPKLIFQLRSYSATIMPAAVAMLGPVVGLNLWTFFMEGWMYALRIPAIQKSGKNFGPDTKKSDFDNFPPHVRWPADNYNHLHEQPTQFYAIALAIAVLGRDKGVSDLDVKLAWTYVGVRVIHSVVQATANPIMKRFSLFLLSSAVLAGLTGRTAMQVFYP